MSDHARSSTDLLASEIEWLAAYDDALIDGLARPLSSPPSDLAPEAAARLQRLERLMQRLHVARTEASEATHVDRHTTPTASDPPKDGASDPAPELPKTLGRFEIIRELGAGGLGVVLLARDPVLERFVALKVPRPQSLFSRDLRLRFLREAQAAARLTHPNLLPVYEAGEAGSICYIAAAYCEGPNLADWLAERPSPLSAAEAARLVLTLAEGMHYAHDHGVIHRDLKPTNVMLDPTLPDQARSACPFVPKITDFGLAKLETSEQVHTRTGVMLGTPSYMAPEQIHSTSATSDRRVDVYGLGAILYELLAGTPPFRGATDADTIRQVSQDDPAPIGAARAGVPRDLEAICLKCLEKQPQKRYETAEALASDLACFLNGRPTDARPATPVERLAKWVRRHPTMAALVSVISAALVTIGVLTSSYVVQLRRANDAAETARVEANESRAEAQSSAGESTRQARIANEYLYASRMRLAYQAIDQGDIDQARKLVDFYAPSTSLAALRGFEWYHLRQRLHSERLTLAGHVGEVYCAAFSPDGKRVISGGQDGTIRVWSAETGEHLKTIPAHQSCVNVVVFAPNGEMLASASCDKTVKLWDSASLEPIATLEGHPGEVKALAFCPTDRSLLATGGSESRVRIWNIDTRQPVRSFETDGVNGLAWRADGKAIFLAAGAPHKAAVYAWNRDNDRLESRSSGSFCVAVSSKGDTCWGMHRLALHEYSDKRVEPFTCVGHTGNVDTVAFSPNGDEFATSGDDRTIRVWNSSTNACSRILTGHTARIQCLAYSPDGKTLASASFDGTVKIWNSEPMDRSVRHAPFCGLVDESWKLASISSDFRYLALTGRPDEIHVYDLRDDRRIGALPLERNPVSLQFLPGQSVLFRAIDSAANAEEWDIERWQLTSKPGLLAERLHEVVGWQNYVVMERDAATYVQDVSTGHVWQEIPRTDLERTSHTSRLLLSPDGSQLAISRREATSWILSSRESVGSHGDPTPSAREAPLHLIAIANDGNLIVVRTSDYACEIQDSRSDRVIATLRHPGTVTAGAFSPDGKTLATVYGDQMVILWNVATGQELVQLSAESDEVFKIQFSTDGRRLAAISRTPVTQHERRSAHPYSTQIGPLDEFAAHITVWSGVLGE
jgi:eukaryotic-like serine/threonine-protein kinase